MRSNAAAIAPLSQSRADSPSRLISPDHSQTVQNTIELQTAVTGHSSNARRHPLAAATAVIARRAQVTFH